MYSDTTWRYFIGAYRLTIIPFDCTMADSDSQSNLSLVWCCVLLGSETRIDEFRLSIPLPGLSRVINSLLTYLLISVQWLLWRHCFRWFAVVSEQCRAPRRKASKNAASDVKRGQNLETEAKTTRPTPKVWPRGLDISECYSIKSKAWGKLFYSQCF